jgi:uncharacterized membrane protein YkvA (DUF1232 family)
MPERDFQTDAQRDFYQRFRKRISEWMDRGGRLTQLGEYILAGPDMFHLLVKLSMDSDISMKNTAKLGAAIAYFMSPIEVLPEAIIGPIGFLDDIALAAYVLRDVMEEAGNEKIVENWAGEDHILTLIEDLIDLIDNKLGGGVWKRVLSYLP